VCGGKACNDNTRIRVVDIVQAKREGKQPEEMRNVFAVPLTLAQIYSALAYADENPAETEADFARDDEVERQIERDRAAFSDGGPAGSGWPSRLHGQPRPSAHRRGASSSRLEGRTVGRRLR
jgi:uncharacterized protein (DUF433 family)